MDYDGVSETSLFFNDAGSKEETKGGGDTNFYTNGRFMGL